MTRSHRMNKITKNYLQKPWFTTSNVQFFPFAGGAITNDEDKPQIGILLTKGHIK
jgi:hypothetical protein